MNRQNRSISTKWYLISIFAPPPPPPKNQKSQQLIPAGKVFGLLGFLILFLVTHRCHGAPIGFPGKKTQHRALCAQEIGD
ncbi:MULTISPECIES: hypothetical protein [Vibrio]|uniref:hypothetical protein n=1 Tax=Vibrio TaxID=662 RepID=UPI001F0B0E13|nr:MULTISPECIES: hypothetical protein [Vibrio]